MCCQEDSLSEHAPRSCEFEWYSEGMLELAQLLDRRHWTRSMDSKGVLEHFVNLQWDLSSFHFWNWSCVLRRGNDCFQAECLWISMWIRRLCVFSFVNGNDEVCGIISVWGAEFGDLTMPKLLIVWKDCELTKLFYHVCYSFLLWVYEETPLKARRAGHPCYCIDLLLLLTFRKNALKSLTISKIFGSANALPKRNARQRHSSNSLITKTQPWGTTQMCCTTTMAKWSPMS